MYQVGDKIVYPMHGAGIIDRVEEKEILGSRKKYYILNVPCGDMKIMIPIDKCDAIGIRDIINKNDLSNVYDVLREDSSTMPSNWNRRNRENMERLKTGSILEAAAVVRNLWRMENNKPLSTGEKKLLTTALQILVSELILVQESSFDDVKEQIRQAI